MEDTVGARVVLSGALDHWWQSLGLQVMSIQCLLA